MEQEKSQADVAHTPNRIPWPPLLYGAALIGGLLLGRLAPLPWPAVLDILPARMVGAGLALVGVGLDLSALATLYRAHTNVLPHRAADRLITHGPFALSRNPIYLGNTLLLTGLGIALGNAWLLAGALLAALATHHLAILREEAHLQAKFGTAFEAYRSRVPRWFIR